MIRKSLGLCRLSEWTRAIHHFVQKERRKVGENYVIEGTAECREQGLKISLKNECVRWTKLATAHRRNRLCVCTIQT